MEIRNLFRKTTILLLYSIIFSCTQRPPIPQNHRRLPENRGQNHQQELPRNRRKNPPQASKSQGNWIVEKPTSRVKLSPQEIFETYSSAVFMIFTSSGYNQFQGSGFFINSRGLAVSNYHVFQGTTVGYEIIKLQDGRQYKLKDVILKDRENDIMIFTVDAEQTTFKYLPLSKNQPRVGDKAYAIGSPRGLENTFSSGEISQLREGHIIQISVPIDHGSSGGALINEYGEAIGITSAGLDYSGANLNFAISTDLVRKYLR